LTFCRRAILAAVTPRCFSPAFPGSTRRGVAPSSRDRFYDNNMKGWGPELVKQRPDITMEQVEKFLTRMYRTNPDFVFTVTRDFVRNCRTPVLILPDDIPAHPYAVAMEAARRWR
jgi:hypothetical protein